MGSTKDTAEISGTWDQNALRFLMCNHGWSDHDRAENFHLYILQQFACIIKTVITSLINTNVPEAFLYFKIFSKMNR